MKKVILAVSFLTLSACGGSGGGSPSTTPSSASSSTSNTTNEVKETADKIEINGSNNTVTVTSKKGVEITGSGNTVYIQTSISYLDIVGGDNILEISNGVTVGECNIVGSNNKAIKSELIKIPCDIVGGDNPGFN